MILKKQKQISASYMKTQQIFNAKQLFLLDNVSEFQPAFFVRPLRGFFRLDLSFDRGPLEVHPRN
jgi:hypothetical protein